MDVQAIKLAFIRATLVVAKFVVVTALLCLSAIRPLAGWHRLVLRVRGWWIWPAVAALAFVAFNIVVASQAQLRIWYLLAIAPYCALMIVDSWLVLPWCIEHTSKQMDRYQGREIAT